jgi:PIN domain nuclease of toxin-antitoxin system
MKLLIDTHAFIWFIDDDPRLSRSTDAAFDAYQVTRYW